MVYNDLNGEEIKQILEVRFSQLLDEVTYLQRHITLPRVKMTLSVQLDIYAESPNPERQLITHSLEVIDENYTPTPADNKGYKSVDLRSSIDSSPKGQPPDQIREEHGVPIPYPSVTLDSRGRKIAIEDRLGLEGREVEMVPGVKVDRTQREHRGTFVVQDLGPAGLDDPARRDPRRDQGLPIKQADRNGPVAPPNWNNVEDS